MSLTYPRGRFWDNVIPLRGDTWGHQLAGWTPGAGVRRGLGCQLLANEMIPVADNVSLAADVCTPRTPGRYPAVVVFSAYSKELQSTGAPAGSNETGSPPVFTDRGYAHVVVERRGMGASQGESYAYFNDQDVEDHARVIAWAADQPWCDGHVVLFGTSYYGMVQPQVARLKPPALKGFFAIELCTDYFRQNTMFGGAPQPDFLALWMGANFTPFRAALKLPPAVRALLSNLFNSPLKHLWWPLMRRRMTRIMKGFQKNTPTRWARELFAGMVFDGKTRATAVLPDGPTGHLDEIETPFVVVQNPGFFNLHQFGGYDLFENAGTAPDRKWLIVSPPGYQLPADHWQLEALAFFDHVIFGVDNGYREQAPVRYWVEGADSYRLANSFPPKGHQASRFYLGSGGPDARMHRLSAAPVNTGANRWAATPYGAIVAAGLDEVANPILRYEMSVDREVTYAGPVTASLRFSCNEIDSHVVARLGRVDLSGKFHILSLGSIRPACRKIDEGRSTSVEIAIDMDTPEPLTRGEPVTLRFSLTPQPIRLAPGELLRFEIASRTDLLRSDQSHGRAHFDMQTPPYYSRNCIHYGPDSYVELSEVSP